MGVYIKGLELPKDFGNYYGRYTLCISEDGVNILGVDGELYRVVELSPHGRLIDADELIEQKEWAFDGMGQTEMVNVAEIANAPTVLEAEGKDNG